MDALELIKTRRSTRRFQHKPIEHEKLSEILEAGRYAPSIDLQLKLTHVLHSKLTHPCNEDYVS